MKVQDADVYGKFLEEVKGRLRDDLVDAGGARHAWKVHFYWNLGRMICEKRRGLGWDRPVAVRLASDLQEEYPGAHGFSADNIMRMEEFYMNYHLGKFPTPLPAEIRLKPKNRFGGLISRVLYHLSGDRGSIKPSGW
jgi:hypothetical protein